MNILCLLITCSLSLFYPIAAAITRSWILWMVSTQSPYPNFIGIFTYIRSTVHFTSSVNAFFNLASIFLAFIWFYSLVFRLSADEHYWRYNSIKQLRSRTSYSLTFFLLLLLPMYGFTMALLNLTFLIYSCQNSLWKGCYCDHLCTINPTVQT